MYVFYLLIKVLFAVLYMFYDFPEKMIMNRKKLSRVKFGKYCKDFT